MPFRLMGQLNDGQDNVVYLSAGDSVFTAKAGDPVGTDYRLVSLDSQALLFEYLPTGEQQHLPIEPLSP
ncbi:MAG: hypothetical protein E6Q99_02645 [Elusimicrobia bacterium]|nr:MAG: hypothetical protein E6Q99_02645 [Elusimicrobiota bacterium]